MIGTAQAKPVATGYRVQCARCEVFSFTARDDAHAYWAAPSTPNRYYCFLPCRNCGLHLPVKTVAGKQGKRPCGTWCTEGTGVSCACQCGGSSHGSAYPAGALWFLR